MATLPETKYAMSADYHIAYQAIGTGPLHLVFMHGWISHIEHMWEEPRVARFLDRLASFSRLILIDKRGTGMSDPVPLDQLPTLEERYRRRSRCIGCCRIKAGRLFGNFGGGSAELAVRGDVSIPEPRHWCFLTPMRGWRTRLITLKGIPAEQAQGLLQAIEEGWGKGVAFEALVASQSDNASMKSWWARYQRLAASPGAAVTLLRSAYETDARSVLPAIAVPVLCLASRRRSIHRAGARALPRGAYSRREVRRAVGG